MINLDNHYQDYIPIVNYRCLFCSDGGEVDKKYLELWTVDDVSSWLDDLGLADYQQNFMDNKINGKMLFEIEKSDLETLVGIFNPLHQRMFICTHWSNSAGLLHCGITTLNMMVTHYL